jgi:small subunit ribosomal protein S17
MAKKILKGTVVSNNLDKTVSVEVVNQKQHPRYIKSLTVTKKYLARTENKYAIGDSVSIIESKPYSKKVTWEVIEK